MYTVQYRGLIVVNFTFHMIDDDLFGRQYSLEYCIVTTSKAVN